MAATNSINLVKISVDNHYFFNTIHSFINAYILGLGIFIAQTLLQHTGANLTFGNQNGGKVVISWARAILDTDNIDGEKK